MNDTETTLENYRRRINRMIDYISQHLDENPSLETLASAAGFSPYHFHRIAKAFLGETIGNFIVRKRVETAAHLLKQTDLSIHDIAYQVGYDMASSLSKSFKSFYGISPIAYRTNKNNLIMKDVKKAPYMELQERIEVLAPKEAICYSLQGDYRTCDYAKAWKTIERFSSTHQISMNEAEYLTIYYDDPSITAPEKQRADVCLVPKESFVPADGVTAKEIAGGKYAIYLYQGTYQKLNEVYDTIYGKYLPQGDFKLDNRPMFEKYLNDPATTKPEALLTEIYVPIL